MNEISDRVPARRDVPLKNKRLERLMQMKLLPVDLAIAERYAEYNQEFLSILGSKNSAAGQRGARRIFLRDVTPLGPVELFYESTFFEFR